MSPWSEAPKGRDSKAQGNALGIGWRGLLRPEGATPAGGSALSGLGFSREHFPGRCPGLSTLRPFGAPSHRQLPTENSEEPAGEARAVRKPHSGEGGATHRISVFCSYRVRSSVPHRGTVRMSFGPAEAGTTNHGHAPTGQCNKLRCARRNALHEFGRLEAGGGSFRPVWGDVSILPICLHREP